MNPAATLTADDELAPRREATQLRQAIGGDSAAFEALVRQHYDRVWRFALKWVRDDAIAQDLAQETFLAAWQKLPTFRSESQFSTWLLGITLNLARNHRNRGPQRMEVELPDDSAHLERLAQAAEGVDDLLARRQTVIALDRAVSRLPVEMREVLLLARLEGLPLQDIADLLGVALGTVKSRLNRARERLLLELGETR